MSNIPGYQLDRRLGERAKVPPSNMPAAWGLIENTLICDLSDFGCSVKSGHIALAIGQELLVRAPSVLGAHGTVRWVEGQHAGIEFSKPLRPSVAREFAKGNRVALIVLGSAAHEI